MLIIAVLYLYCSMDPKNAAGLDPKLKEAYDRVMNANVPPAAAAAPAIPPTTPPMPTTTVAPTATPLAQPAAPSATAKTQTTSFVPAASKPAGGGKSKTLLFGVGVVLFLLVYAFFWVKFFNLPLPFALPF